MLRSLGVLVVMAASAFGDVNDGATLFADGLRDATLGPAWTVDASAGNTVRPSDAGLVLEADENTYAHIQRPIGQDFVRVTAALEPGNGISWATSLFLYWSPGDWVQFGVIPRKDGRYYACVTTGGQRAEFDLARCTYAGWHDVGIDLAEDGIRFLVRNGAGEWATEHVIARPAALQDAPALLIVGKGFGVDASQSDLNGDYGVRGARATSRVRDVAVAVVPPERRRISAAEWQRQAQALQDPDGAELLAGGEPDFDRVARIYPPLQQPREATGVPGHRYEVGVEYDGSVQLADDSDLWEQTGTAAYFEVGTPATRFGTGGCTKRLLDGWKPIVVLDWAAGDCVCEETVFGTSDGFSVDTPLYAWVRLQVTNRGMQAVEWPVRVGFDRAPAGRAGPTTTLKLAPGVAGDVYLRVPSPLGSGAAEWVSEDAYAAALAATRAAWDAYAAEGMQVETPEPRVNNAWRAWLAYNALDVDRVGDVWEPHDGAGFYEEVFGYSAALYCHTLDLWGRHAEAQRIMDTLLTRQRDDGLWFIRYGMPDHGAMLLAIAEHARLTGDTVWLRSVTARVLRMCAWTHAEREKALAEERSALTRGLIRFTPYADYQGQTFNYYGDAYCCVGLRYAADALARAGLTADAERVAADAAAYERDIRASMDAALFEHEGRTLLPLEPDTRRIIASTNYRGGDYYGLVASMLLETGLLDVQSPPAQALVGALEQNGGLRVGMCAFDEGIDHAYTYGYWMNCLAREEVDRVLLGFYGSLAYGMGRDTYCGVEVTQITTGVPTPTTPHLYSGTQQLRLLRAMLIREHNGTLDIAPAVPRAWLRPGGHLRVQAAPVTGGAVSYELEAADDGTLKCTVSTTAERLPAVVRIHLRRPGAAALQPATVESDAECVVAGDVLEIRNGGQAVVVRVR